MESAVIAAIITGAVTLLGTIITVLAASKKTDEAFRISQAVMEERINRLTEEVRVHNSFARRMPVVEEQIKVINHRIADLEDDKK